MTWKGKNPLTFSLFFNFRITFSFSMRINLRDTTIVNFESFTAQCTQCRKLVNNYWVYQTDLTFPVFLIRCFIFTQNSVYFSWFLLFFNFSLIFFSFFTKIKKNHKFINCLTIFSLQTLYYLNTKFRNTNSFYKIFIACYD